MVSRPTGLSHTPKKKRTIRSPMASGSPATIAGTASAGRTGKPNAATKRSSLPSK